MMPSSQFLKNLIAFKDSQANAKEKNTDLAKGYQHLQKKLNLEQPSLGMLCRLFDELPRELTESKAISTLEKNFLSLFRDDKFPTAKTILLRDQIIMQAYHDLLDNEGKLQTDFIQLMNLDTYFKKEGETVCTRALISSYVGYIGGLLSAKVGIEEQKRMDAGIMKGLSEAAPRTSIISHILNVDRDKHIANTIETTSFAYTLRAISQSLTTASQQQMEKYCKQLAERVNKELETKATIRRSCAVKFWVDVMYASKMFGDHNTVYAIHEGLRQIHANQKILFTTELQLKYNYCNTLVNAGNSYANFTQNKKMRDAAELETILFFSFMPKYSKEGKAIDTALAVEKIFKADQRYQRYITNMTSKACDEIEITQTKIEAELKNLQSFMREIQLSIKPTSEANKTILSYLFTFVMTDENLYAHQLLAEFFRLIHKDELMVSTISYYTKYTVDRLNDLLDAEDENSLVSKTIATLRTIKEHCTHLMQLGQIQIPTFAVAKTLTLA